MKKLIFMNNLSLGGAQRFVQTISDHWMQSGHDVVIVTILGKEYDAFKLAPTIKRITLDERLTPIRFFVKIQRLLVLRKVLCEEAPDIAFGIISSASCLLGLASINSGIPVVACERSYPPRDAPGWLWGQLRQQVYPRIAAVAIQTDLGRTWLETNIKTREVAVIPNFLTYPLVDRDPIVKPPPKNGKRYLLSVGRISEEKRYLELISVFSKTCASFPDWELIIVGEGPLMPELKSHIEELGLKEKVHLPGRVGNLSNWYHHSDLFVLNSRFEGFPNVILEALACALPVISRDCKTGPREIIRHETDGLLVEEDNDLAMQQAMERLMGSSSLRESYSEKAPEVLERFSAKLIGQKWDDLIARVKSQSV